MTTIGQGLKVVALLLIDLLRCRYGDIFVGR